MGEFASKGLANGVGIPALVLGSLGFLQSGGLGGGIGGLFSGGTSQAAMMANAAGQAAMAEKDSIIAQLKSEKYADQVGIGVYKQAAADNKDLGDRILGNWVKPLAQESAANRERLATLEAKVDGNKALTDKDMDLLRKDVEISNLNSKIGFEKLENQINVVALTAKQGISSNSAAIASLQATVDGIVCTKVCRDSICPEVMPRYNSWVAPTAEAPATQPVTGTINVAK